MTATASTGDKSARMPRAERSHEPESLQPAMDPGHGYSLRLADGQGWHLVGTGKTRLFLEKLAAILDLRPGAGEDYSELVFTTSIADLDDQHGASRLSRMMGVAGLPSGPWTRHTFGPLRIWSRDDRSDLICELDTEQTRPDDTQAILAMWFVVSLMYRQAQSRGALPVHAALLGKRRIGVMLGGSGGIGKSTCCKRVPLPWHPLCDDETLIVRNEQGHYVAHPFPTWSQYLWTGSGPRWPTEDYLPVSAICFLDRGTTDQMAPIPQGAAAVQLYQSAAQVHTRIWPHVSGEETTYLKRQLFENACPIAKSVPVYRLQLSAGGAFWKELEKVLGHQDQEPANPLGGLYQDCFRDYFF